MKLMMMDQFVQVKRLQTLETFGIYAFVFFQLFQCGVISDDVLCNTKDWNIIKGSWEYDIDNETCSVSNTNNANGNIVWFGSADGNTYNTNYSSYSFSLELSVSISSGADNAGILFRAANVSTVNDGGYQYLFGFRVAANNVFLGRMHNDWTEHRQTTLTNLTFEYGTPYLLKIESNGSYYNYSVNNILLWSENHYISTMTRTYGSFGLRTNNAPSTFHYVNLTIIQDSTSTSIPTSTPTVGPSSRPTFVPSLTPTSTSIFTSSATSSSTSSAVDLPTYTNANVTSSQAPLVDPTTVANASFTVATSVSTMHEGICM